MQFYVERKKELYVYFIVRLCDQRKHQVNSLEQTHYKDILNRDLSILFQESNNLNLTESDVL